MRANPTSGRFCSCSLREKNDFCGTGSSRSCLGFVLCTLMLLWWIQTEIWADIWVCSAATFASYLDLLINQSYLLNFYFVLNFYSITVHNYGFRQPVFQWSHDSQKLWGGATEGSVFAKWTNVKSSTSWTLTNQGLGFECDMWVASFSKTWNCQSLKMLSYKTN